ncbi:CBS domain containing membrane protein [Segniliparus rotundus DSM 44985]|uniref:CBS domain containing membrane protein n=1 Tax=Segniliparus rotundus (strain ATCC BAA-972 / CDC 1076 / CIP 108378 / DSM 44985 / JCM 13578) TaxID=640132 RepID=D6ZAS7_SEGRD|nr:CBS domain-containing protein [Segniliparus rotundus]ADG98813.1 CBS domain containing membrane protein [Segniliparus rotundus DSM 44985]
MRARDIMSSPVVVVTPDMPVHEATALLAGRGFTSLPVVDKDGNLVGVVGEHELMRAQPSLRDRPVVSTVESVMRPCTTGVNAASTAAQLAAVLAEEGRRSVPVLQGSQVIGVVTRRDLLKALSRADWAIMSDIRERLSVYRGVEGWVVELHDGVVGVEGDFDNVAERAMVAGLVESVPGVTSVSLVER